MRFQIKKLLEGYDPADLIEQSMYCFGSDSGSDGGDSTADQDESAGMGGTSSQDMGMDSSSSDQADAQAGSASGVSGQDNSQGSIGIDAFGGKGGAMSNQSTAGIQSALGDMAGGSMVEVDPISGQTTSYSPTQVPELEVMPQIDPYDIQQTQAQNFAQNIGLATMANTSLSPEAMASIGTTGYSPNSVTGFANPTDVSDFTTADQMTSLSPSINNPISNLLTNIGLPTTQNQINQGYTPTYSGGQVTGTTGFGIGMGMPSNNQNMTGSGLAVSGYAPFSSTQPSVDYGNYGDIGGNESEPIKPATTNPVSGQPICPDGYRYDDDLQACRLDTTRPNRPNSPNPFPANEAYYRATTLDKAPLNLPSGFDFNRANQNFVSQFAYRPSAYQNQMGLSGFTPFRRS